jgi:hypothetical protein
VAAAARKPACAPSNPGRHPTHSGIGLTGLRSSTGPPCPGADGRVRFLSKLRRLTGQERDALARFRPVWARTAVIAPFGCPWWIITAVDAASQRLGPRRPLPSCPEPLLGHHQHRVAAAPPAKAASAPGTSRQERRQGYLLHREGRCHLCRQSAPPQLQEAAHQGHAAVAGSGAEILSAGSVFEHMKTGGRLLPQRSKAMLKALARLGPHRSVAGFSLLSGDR